MESRSKSFCPTNTVTVVDSKLPPAELHESGQFLPFAFVGHLQRGAVELLQGVEGVALDGQLSLKVFAAIVVGNLQAGAVVVSLHRNDKPAVACAVLYHIAGHLAKKLLAGNDDVLFIEIDVQGYRIFGIIKVTVERTIGLPHTEGAKRGKEYE